MADVDHRRDVDGQHAGEIVCVAVQERPLSGEAGVVDHQVDVPVDEFAQATAGPLRGQIEGDAGARDPVLRLETVGERVEPISSASHQHEVATARRQRSGEGLSDSRAGKQKFKNRT